VQILGSLSTAETSSAKRRRGDSAAYIQVCIDTHLSLHRAGVQTTASAAQARAHGLWSVQPYSL